MGSEEGTAEGIAELATGLELELGGSVEFA